MKKSKWMTMAAVLTLSTTMAMAAPHGGKRGERHGRERGEFSERFAQKLKLHVIPTCRSATTGVARPRKIRSLVLSGRL